MGKKAKEHRKKVQARNQKLVAARKKFEKEMGEAFKTHMNEVKTTTGTGANVVYASTGDFISKNYDKILEQNNTEYLEKHSDVAFS